MTISKMFNLFSVFVLLMLSLSIGDVKATETISVQALFKDKAIVVLDGKRYVMSTGMVRDGVELISTNTQQETVQVKINGKVEVLNLNVVRMPLNTTQNSNQRNTITLVKEDGHFYANGTIYDVPLEFLVDTGATFITLTATQANRMGINYKAGKLGQAQTASNTVPAYYFTLDAVTVGNITLHNVKASVIEGSNLSKALLGMSFLERVDMNLNDGKMELIER